MEHGSMSIDELLDFIAGETRRVREEVGPPAAHDGDAQPQRRVRRRRGWRGARVACGTRSRRSALVH